MLDCHFRGVKIAIDAKAKTPAPGKQKDFKLYMDTEGVKSAELQALKDEVLAFATSFPHPGK